MQFRTFTTLAILAALLISPVSRAAAQTPPPPALMATINAVLTDTNANDLSRLDSYYTPNAVVVDEFAPYVWTGSQAASQWWAGVEQLNKKLQISGMKAAAQPVRHFDMSGEKAYVVVPLVLSYTYKNKPQKETGTITCTLLNTGGAWKIATQTWSTETNTM